MKNLLLSALTVFSLTACAIKGFECDGLAFSAYQEKEFKKVETAQVPADILKQVSTRYSGYALVEAFASQDDDYKLVLSKDGKSINAYYKSTGEFIKEEA